ncbi:MAG: asparaginase [Gammaproteobacteria bacterium]|nr:asparaginase [Gammaproteobacteria bacterium]
MRFCILTTGGTIDKIYFDANSEFQIGDPQIIELLQEANVTCDYRVEPVLRKDSLELNEDDRNLIADRLLQCSEQQILITHGTDTMAETARRLIGICDKTIVLTGAMQPARLRISDAVFNIGFAMGALQQLPAGVYIAMNGQIFDPAHCHKNLKDKRFEID